MRKSNVYRYSSAIWALCALLSSASLHAQQTQSPAERVIPHVSYNYDPIHDVIEATSELLTTRTAPSSSSDTSTTPKTYTGTANITLTIDLVSTLPTGTALRCSGNLNLQYLLQENSSATSGPILIDNVVLSTVESVDAVVSSKKAVCHYTIPYSWTVPESTSTTTVGTSLIEVAMGVSADVLDSSGSVQRVLRSTSLQIPGPASIPPDGSTINLSGSTVL